MNACCGVSVGIGGFAAIAQQQTEVTAGQRRHHEEVIGADAVVKVIVSSR